jgi:hypothetical protein
VAVVTAAGGCGAVVATMGARTAGLFGGRACCGIHLHLSHIDVARSLLTISCRARRTVAALSSGGRSATLHGWMGLASVIGAKRRRLVGWRLAPPGNRRVVRAPRVRAREDRDPSSCSARAR